MFGPSQKAVNYRRFGVWVDNKFQAVLQECVDGAQGQGFRDGKAYNEVLSQLNGTLCQ